MTAPALLYYDPVDTFRMFRFIREHGGQNHGVWVNAVQRIGNCQDGDSYCAAACCMVLDMCTQLGSPFSRSAACQDFYATAKANGWVVSADDAVPGDLVVTVNAVDHAHHIGMYTGLDADGRRCSIAGNTSEDGTSSNGDGFHEHPLLAPKEGRHVFIHWPRQFVSAAVAA